MCVDFLRKVLGEKGGEERVVKSLTDVGLLKEECKNDNCIGEKLAAAREFEIRSYCEGKDKTGPGGEGEGEKGKVGEEFFLKPI